MGKDTAVILVSGGMDSCVTAAAALEQYLPAFLHVNYGQRTEARELTAFNALADHYRVERKLIVSFDHLRAIGGSALTDKGIPVPVSGQSSSAVPATYVPFRNAHLLSIAVSWAEVIGAVKIFIGAVEEDGSGYPDCRESFYRAFNAAIELGTKPETRIEIVAPLIHLTKPEIVRKGVALRAPFHLTWSCYQNSDRACGVCESCALRLKGFHGAGVEDPIPYEPR
jgi:7-cyano-7-deazaguanine synthase